MRVFGRVGVLILAAALLSSCIRADVTNLASDTFDGRNNGTAGSTLAQNYLLNYLRAWTIGPNSSQTGDNAYKQPFEAGTNIIGVLPGTDLADEYVLLGAHYDHVQSCRDLRPGDAICNGATDNAASVAVLIDVLRGLAYAPEPPRRSIIFAFWDREEDGLIGSRFYAQNPLVPLDDTVAYLNLDIQGANLRPSLRNSTVAVGSETGGARLRQLVDEAAAPSSLDTNQLSVIFGQGRSDHVNFIAEGVPTVFFTDATGPCYHTDSDDVAVVDFDKLEQQTQTLRRLTNALASTNSLPSFVSGTPLATYDDAVVLATTIDTLEPDFPTFPPAQATQLEGFQTELHQIVAAGPAAFDNPEITRILTIAATTVGFFTSGPCDGFLAPGG
jgi:Zn-dependent M28 family amino/carboxypeptidase